MRGLAALLSLALCSCLGSEADRGFDPNYCPAVSDWDPTWSALESEVVRIANLRRAEGATCGSRAFGPAPALEVSEELRCAARNHSKDMVARGYFAHESPEGDNAGDRLERAGFDWSLAGENIAQGHETAEAVMQGWMGSPGHCENVLEPRFELIGVGYHAGASRRHVWTQTFGAY